MIALSVSGYGEAGTGEAGTGEAGTGEAVDPWLLALQNDIGLRYCIIEATAVTIMIFTPDSARTVHPNYTYRTVVNYLMKRIKCDPDNTQDIR